MKQDSTLIAFHDLAPETETFAEGLLAGFSKPQKSIPCQFLYDLRGSQLFNDICETPEYYPTRTEIGILRDVAPEIARLMGSGVQIIELGSGSSRKIQLLLDLLHHPAGYVAIDISSDHLRDAANQVAREHPNLPVTAVCGDYMRLHALPDRLTGDYAKRALFFPGSTIGNLEPAAAETLLRSCGEIAGPGGDFLIGVDLQKNEAVLNAAYNDAEGVTANFTLNLLARANRELGADFDLANFRHLAFYNPDQQRIEIYLESLADQRVHAAGQAFDIAKSERILTEYSYKYTLDGFRMLARLAGWTTLRSWTDDRGLFSVHYMRRE